MNSVADPNGAPDASTASSPAPLNAKPLVVRVIGLGGAGGNAVAHLAQGDLRELRPAAIHTNARILEMTAAPEKFLLGADVTLGLGAGGDPSLARAAAEHDLPTLKKLCQGVDLLFIVTGLGGGTGTGAAPVLARVGKESGALVLGLATLPFDLEGARRAEQARRGLDELKAAADAVICLPNQKLFRIVDEKTSVLEGLKTTNDLLAQGIRGIWQMLTRPSLIHVDFADLRAVLRDQHVEGAFATVEVQGEGRSRELIEQLLASPLLEGGQTLTEAGTVLVNLLGGPDMTLAEVKKVMEEINRRTNNAHLIMGASISDELQNRLGITLVASRRNEPLGDPSFPANRIRAVSPSTATAVTDVQPRYVDASESEASTLASGPNPPRSPDADPILGFPANGVGRPGSTGTRRLQQARLPLEIVSKGRFEKSHPTIHRGEDLDLPTYVRRGIPLN